MELLHLSKYEALGNDFLIRLADDGDRTLSPALVSALCDRHRGIGADGLIELRRSDRGLSMTLTNADGSPAETSGNGLRCAALAAFDAGVVDGNSVVLTTVVGDRRADLVSGGDGAAEIRVEMGEVTVEPTESPIAGRQAFRVDVGNPHLVLLGTSIDDVDLEVIGPLLEASVPGGQNVEIIAGRGLDELDLAVFERGAGITEACGSGSCAAAAAAHLVGGVGAVVVVHNPGGPLTVELEGADFSRPTASLVGPAHRIGAIDVRTEDLTDSLASVGGTLARR